MEIRWLGNSTFEIRSSAGIVVVDHQGALPKTSEIEDENTIFAFSQGDHVSHPAGKHQVLTGPGEYEIGGHLVCAASPHRPMTRRSRAK